MNPIELSKEQKDKLLEMCKKLFPDNATWRFDQNTYPRFLEYSDKGNIAKRMHWFEFCINILLREIAEHLTYIPDYGFDPEGFDKKHKKYLKKVLMFDEPKHPVDYLYKEFKKIK